MGNTLIKDLTLVKYAFFVRIQVASVTIMWSSSCCVYMSNISLNWKIKAQNSLKFQQSNKHVERATTYPNLIARGTVYINTLIWKTHTKNILKCSNISVKKYQKRPMLGWRLGTDTLQQINNSNINIIQSKKIECSLSYNLRDNLLTLI